MSKTSAYFGSKVTSGLCQPLIGMMPPHETYIETHLGGGAMMKRKQAARNNIRLGLNQRSLSKFDCHYPVTLVNGCTHLFLTHYHYHGSERVYCDPPYLLQTRASQRRYRFDYREQEHIELLKILKTLACHVILSGYASSLYDDLLTGGDTVETVRQ